MRKVSGKGLEKIETHALYSTNFSLENRVFYDNAETYGRARQATGENIVRRVLFACRIDKARTQTNIQNI
jgi:hypothetical protein